MSKTLLPFALFEELEKIESLNPEEMKTFMKSLQKYCETSGKDFIKVCSDLGLETPSWAGKLTYKQTDILNSIVYKEYGSNVETGWSLNEETGKLDIIGKVRIRYEREKKYLDELKASGIQIGKVDGDFEYDGLNLTTMVDANFPDEVTGNFMVSNNKLVNLEGGPSKVGGKYKCDYNRLTSLSGAPETVKSFDCTNNPSLGSLKGGPKEISGDYYCSDCNLSSLEGFPETLDANSNIYVSRNGLYSLEGIPLNPPVSVYRIRAEKNPLSQDILRGAYREAARTGSWIVGYLSMFTDPDFIKTGKAPKDPIREKLSPENIKKEIETNGPAFVVGLKSIWKDFRVQKMLKGVQIPADTKADAELLADLDDVGL